MSWEKCNIFSQIQFIVSRKSDDQIVFEFCHQSISVISLSCDHIVFKPVKPPSQNNNRKQKKMYRRQTRQLSPNMISPITFKLSQYASQISFYVYINCASLCIKVIKRCIRDILICLRTKSRETETLIHCQMG